MTTQDEGAHIPITQNEKVQLIDVRDPHQVVMVEEDQVSFYQAKLTTKGEQIYYTVGEYEQAIGQRIIPPRYLGQGEQPPEIAQRRPALLPPYDDVGQDLNQHPLPILSSSFRAASGPEAVFVGKDPAPMNGHGQQRNFNPYEMYISMLEQQIMMMQQTVATLRAACQQ